ncbi:hypothetical protein [Flavimobilis soli]|uniref:hypothetical protein n=1 Tax=Flavimobilis soli TaxID=442709 RepID=UPI0014749C41|nr:hypothetical protein [Flavimobilis soli]
MGRRVSGHDRFSAADTIGNRLELLEARAWADLAPPAPSTRPRTVVAASSRT